MPSSARANVFEFVWVVIEATRFQWLGAPLPTTVPEYERSLSSAKLCMAMINSASIEVRVELDYLYKEGMQSYNENEVAKDKEGGCYDVALRNLFVGVWWAYKKDSIDYETLKLEVNSPSKLGLIKEYLLTHKYKEFRDKANKLRVPFEQQLVWSNPTTIQAYTHGLLMKSNETKNGKSTQKTYTYDENGRLVSIKEVTEDKGTTTLQTNFLYDSQGNCVEEVQVNQRGMKEVYKRLRAFSTLGVILSDSAFYQSGKLIVRQYHPQLGLLAGETVYEKNIPVSSVINQYNKKGQIIKREETFPLPKDPLPTQVSKQVDVYEYDTYGYLTKITFEKTLVNSDKTSGSLIFLYDEFGNQIDSNAYYEYDSTGRWIQKTDRGDAKNTEKIQIIYQQ